VRFATAVDRFLVRFIGPEGGDDSRSGTPGDRGEKSKLSLIACRTGAWVAVVWRAAPPGFTRSRFPGAIGRKDPMRTVSTETATLLLLEQPDARLLQWAAECGGTIVTNDAAVRQTAEEQGVPAMSVNELSLALAPKVRRGDEIEVRITKAGKNPDEGIAYLDDGMMVVVEGGQRHVGATITVTVTGVLRSAAGNMVFAAPK
jgi:predicted RNA-binding protein with TRAM domain